jgi:hypothetical protein
MTMQGKYGFSPQPRRSAETWVHPKDPPIFVSSRLLPGTELMLTGFLVVGFLNSELRFGTIARPVVKISLAVASLILLIVSARKRPHRPLGDALPKLSAAALVAYLTTVVVATAVYGVSSEVLSVFVLAIAGSLMLVYSEFLRRGTALRVIRAVVIIHVVIALASWSGPPERADGGSHPITIGLAAGVLLFLAGSQWTSARTDWILRTGLVLLGSVGLYAAFSRSAIIPAVGAVVIWGAFRPGILRPLRILVLALVSFVLAGRVWQILVLTLSQGDVQAFYSGTGRSVIWGRVWTLRDVYLAHGVGLSNIDGSSYFGYLLLRASLNLPTENSLLQALIAGGLIGAFAWVTVVFTCVIAIARTSWSSFTRIGLTAMVAVGCVFNAGFAGTGFGWPMLVGLLAAATGAQSVPEQQNTGHDKSQT